MTNKKVQISDILDNIIPEFIKTDNPQFKDFMGQYYVSEEHDFGSTYISENLPELKNISTLGDVGLIEEQTLPPPTSLLPTKPIVLAADILPYDSSIKVYHIDTTVTPAKKLDIEVQGFPQSYGLLKIDNEIITYTSRFYDKDSGVTTFNGCVRGFSGIEEVESQANPEFLKFSNTESTSHESGTIIVNLNFLFLNKFYEKHKTQYLPGLEKRRFKQGLSSENILSRAKDFYSSKGTDTSLQILFQVLFGTPVEIIKPFDETLIPSDAQWSVTDDMIVETLSGNPLNLIGNRLFQGNENNPVASGSADNIQQVFLGKKQYHKISFVKESIDNKFLINPRTQLLQAAETSSRNTITVDSTVGFPENGIFYYLDPDSRYKSYTSATYSSKSYNQFFDCIGASTLPAKTDSGSITITEIPIIGGEFLYGYENNDLTKVCQMRIVGSISGVAENASNTKYFNKDDVVKVKYLGNKPDISDHKYNSWFYNYVSDIFISPLLEGVNYFLPSMRASTLNTSIRHFLRVGDRIDIFNADGSFATDPQDGSELVNIKVDAINSPNQFQISGGVQVGSPLIPFRLRKRLNYTDTSLGLDSLLGDIQNSYYDKDNNTYIAFSGFPGFETSTESGTKTFTSVDVTTQTDSIIDFGNVNHDFYNGERIYYQAPSTTEPSGISLYNTTSDMSTIGLGVTLTSGYYYINKIDDFKVRLSVTSNRVEINDYMLIKFTGISTNVSHSLTPADLEPGAKLTNQNNFKRILKNPIPRDNVSNISGVVGVTLNGVELHSPIINDSIFYGPIKNISVVDKGTEYDVITPPKITISDKNGDGCQIYPSLSGNISKVELLSNGFDYINTPAVTISGGNGSGAILKPKMRAYTHNFFVNDDIIDLSNNKFTNNFQEHKFLDGEEVIYTTGGTPIGITSTNVGFDTNKLSSGSKYYVSRVDKDSFSLAITKNRALSKTNLIDFNAIGTNGHKFTSTKIRKIIDEITVVDSGLSYTNKEIIVDSKIYPPSTEQELITTYSGINSTRDYFYARNHNFKEGDIVDYVCSGTVISGLSTETPYQITVIDKDKFKLSSAGTATSISNTNYDRKLYEKLSSVGVGTHTFKYPDIKIKIDGLVSAGTTDIVPTYYHATAYPQIRGGIDSVYIGVGGTNYGSENVVNYNRQPNIVVSNGEGASLIPIIDSGKIVDVLIMNGGSGYSTLPEINVVGTGITSGNFARLRAITNNVGVITAINILDSGKNYVRNETELNVVPVGKDASLNANVNQWKFNAVKYYESYLENNSNDDMVQLPSSQADKGLKLASFYPGRKYRNMLGDNIGDSPNYQESTIEHSKIVGWAYDGNPIFGPVGVDNDGLLNRMKSGYSISLSGQTGVRPSLSVWEEGMFLEDYRFNHDGDLDEFNGKFIKPGENNDFPEGSYAYFATIDSVNKKPSFPYVTFKHYNKTDEFNYDIDIDQSDEYINTGDYQRSVTHLGLAEPVRNYPFLESPLQSRVEINIDSVDGSSITTISVDESGDNYKVGDIVNFDNGRINAEVDEVIGKEIVSVATTTTTLDNVKFSIYNGTVTGITTIPHGIVSGNVVEISGISSSLYKNIEGFRTVGVATVAAVTTVSIGNTTEDSNISLSIPTSTGRFGINDTIRINDEEMLIVDLDYANNRYRVRRAYNESTVSTHGESVTVTKLPKSFTYKVDQKVENVNIESGDIKFFNASQSVGVGSTYSSVGVSSVGINTVYRSIPERAIYLPGHTFKTGDELNLVSVGATIFGATDVTDDPNNPFDTDENFDISDISPLYCVKLGDDYIGLSTVKNGFTTDYVYFSEVQTTIFDTNSLEVIRENITGSLEKVNATVSVAAATTTGNQHSIIAGDKVRLDITSNEERTIPLKYNDVAKRLIVDENTVPSTGISTITSEITIPNHSYKTGDRVVYTNSAGVATPLSNNGEYYVIKASKDTIKLAEYEYDLSVFPYNAIGFSTTGTSNSKIGRINPNLKVYYGNTINFNTSDSSLSGYDIDFYLDKNFASKFRDSSIVKNGTFGTNSGNIVISIGSSFPNELYYKIEGKGSNYIKTFPSVVDEDVVNSSRIDVLESRFNKVHTVSGIGSTTFSFALVGAAETTSYDQLGFSTAFYSTNSKLEQSGIYSVRVVSSPDNLTSLPILTSIASTIGSEAVLKVNSDSIGRINSVFIPHQGLEFPSDNTLRPTADSNAIISLKDLLTIDSIGVTTGGRNYTLPPTPLAIGKPSITGRSNLRSGSVDSVTLISNDSGLTEGLKIIPINNSNGIGVVNATSNPNGYGEPINTLTLKVPGNFVGYTTATFPFRIGDEIFVENVDIVGGANSTADGYNSSDYDYKQFTVVGFNTITPSIDYSIVGLGSTGGVYDSTTGEFGRVIKATDLVIYEPEFRKVHFYQGETVKSTDGKVSGEVSSWNPNTQILKLTNNIGEFSRNDNLYGVVSNSKAAVVSPLYSDFDLSVDSVNKHINTWRVETGKLNSDLQRLHDNDYYQRFSYAVKGEIPYDSWRDPVSSLSHVSGFKNFGNLGITSTVSSKPTADGDLIINIGIDEESSLYDRYWFDYVTEDTDTGEYSKIIQFENVIITDYNESSTNKVLLINDVSDQFNGITTSVGGDVVGLSTFSIDTTIGGTRRSLFSHTFNPNTVIGTANSEKHSFNIPEHQFNTGEELTYIPRGKITGFSVDTAYSNSRQSNNFLGIEAIGNTGIGTGAKFSMNPNIGGAINIVMSGGGFGYRIGDVLTFTDSQINVGLGQPDIEITVTGTSGDIVIEEANVGGAATTILPSTVYAIKDGDNDFRVASTYNNSFAGIGLTFTTLDGSVPAYGSDANGDHIIHTKSEAASIRTLISIDNVIQSPLANNPISLSLTCPVGVNSSILYVNDASKISGKSILKINNELLRVNTVGIGSTTALNVTRGTMGTQIGSHSIGAGITVQSGDYRIDKGSLHFNSAPYGPSGTFNTKSTFHGRVFYRIDYSNNYNFDDISESFNGTTDEFTLRQNGVKLPVGINSFFGVVLLNNIFQKPYHGDIGSESVTDYNVGTGVTISFTGTAANKDLPRGGVINEFSVSEGVGYQRPTVALANPVIGAGGTIASVGIITAGFGYISSPHVSIGVTYKHYEHQFIDAEPDAVEDNTTAKHTPTYAEYNSSTGRLILTIPNHGLETTNKIKFVDESLKFTCSRDAFQTVKRYPRDTDPVVGILTAILSKTTNTVEVYIGTGAGTGAKFNAVIGTAGSITSIVVTNPGTGYTTSDYPIITIDPPAPYKNIPLVGGSGSGATIDVVVGTGGSIIDFDISNRGTGYEVDETLELSGLPVQPGITTAPFKIKIKNEYKDKFSGWNFGRLFEMDDFSYLFNGYRKSFLITRTTGGSREFYSISKKEGSNIILANNLLLFLNDVLQLPGEDYSFEGGTKVTFTEAPKPESKFKFYMYTGSDNDVDFVDVDETVKVGDMLTIQTGITTVGLDTFEGSGYMNRPNNPIPGPQDSRTVFELTASDTVTTDNYFGEGITTDNDIERPVIWTKQRTDKVIDGLTVSKSRGYLSSQIYPATNVLKNILDSDTKIWVEDAYNFDRVDGMEQALNDVTIVGIPTVGIGTTSKVEKIEDVTYTGDYGTIIDIETETSPNRVLFTLRPNSNIQSPAPGTGQVTRPGITTGDYFVIRNTMIGNITGGTQSLDNSNNTVSIGNSFIDNIYYASTWVSSGTTAITVTCKVDSLTGINTNGLLNVPSKYSALPKYGTYSWGTINCSARPTSSALGFNTTSVGLQTSPQVIRAIQMKLLTSDPRN